MTMMRRARSRSFSDPTCTSTIRLPYVLPIRIIDAVVSMLRTIFVAVPAFSRVEPAITSGPTAGAIVRSTKVCSSVRGSQVTNTIFEPARRARVSAPRTNCVIPLADTPMTTSFLVGRSRLIERAPSS